MLASIEGRSIGGRTSRSWKALRLEDPGTLPALLLTSTAWHWHDPDVTGQPVHRGSWAGRRRRFPFFLTCQTRYIACRKPRLLLWTAIFVQELDSWTNKTWQRRNARLRSQGWQDAPRQGELCGGRSSSGSGQPGVWCSGRSWHSPWARQHRFRCQNVQCLDIYCQWSPWRGKL